MTRRSDRFRRHVSHGLSAIMAGLDPIGAKIVSRIDRHRSFIVMIRLDRTIVLPKIALTSVLMPMVRSSRTMTRDQGCHAARRAISAPMGLDPAISRRTPRDEISGSGRATAILACRATRIPGARQAPGGTR